MTSSWGGRRLCPNNCNNLVHKSKKTLNKVEKN